MKQLIKSIEKLKKSKIKKIIKTRIKEFEKIKSNDKIFQELCFCILTANFNAKKSIKIQKELGKRFSTLPRAELARKLKKLGHRYPNMRAKYIVEARKHKGILEELLKSSNEAELRLWLVKNVKGLGYKEASHFLRNIGYKNSAIIDFHIIDILERYKVIRRPKTITKKKYLKVESVLKKIAKTSNLDLAQLDLYLWFSETGKVLK